MEHPRYQRALLLFEQGRDELAESELRQLLAEDPGHARGHAVLARILSQREQFEQATAEAMEAVHRAPDDAFTHQTMGLVMLRRNQFQEAEQAAIQAISLAPEWASNFSLMAQIHLAERRWQDALTAAELGLRADPQDSACANFKAMALSRLGRRQEAQQVITTTLAQHPDDAWTHCTRGWTLLQEGKPGEALEHFRESLRLEPTEEARQGIVEALKARNIVYRWMLGYFFWMARLGRGSQWLVLVGGWFAFRALRRLAANVPAAAPFVLPLIVAYVVFAVMTWIAIPLANLLLRLNRYGRLALNREQIITSNWVGGCVAAVLVSLLLAAVLRESLLLRLALVFGLLIPPLSCIYNCESGWPRKVMAVVTLGLAACGIVAISLLASAKHLPSLDQQARAIAAGYGDLSFTAFLLLALASQFAANALVSARVRR